MIAPRVDELTPAAVAAIIAREAAERRGEHSSGVRLGDLVVLRWLWNVEPMGNA